MRFKLPILRKNSERCGNLEDAIREREEIQEQEINLIRKLNGKPAPDAPDSVAIVVEPE